MAPPKPLQNGSEMVIGMRATIVAKDVNRTGSNLLEAASEIESCKFSLNADTV